MYSLRNALKSDIVRISEIELKSFVSEAFSHGQFLRLLKSPNSHFLVYDSGNKVNGYILLLRRKNCRWLRIYSIAVDTAERGKKIGTLLLAEAERIAALLKLEGLSLEVRQDNTTAIEFYKKHGFQMTATIIDYYEPGIHGLKMKKTLNISSD